MRSIQKEIEMVISLAKAAKNCYKAGLEDGENITDDDIIIVFNVLLERLEIILNMVKIIKV